MPLYEYTCRKCQHTFENACFVTQFCDPVNVPQQVRE